MQNIPPSVSHFLQNLHLTRLESCLFVYRARSTLHLPTSLLSLTASVVGIWKSTKILSAARALTRLFTEKRWPSRFPPSSGDNSPRLPLSTPRRFFCKRGSAVPVSGGGATLQHLKQNPPADLVKSLTELTKQRALTETVKTCQSFLHSPRRRCQAALLLFQAAQTASPPSLCHTPQTTLEDSLKLPQD